MPTLSLIYLMLLTPTNSLKIKDNILQHFSPNSIEQYFEKEEAALTPLNEEKTALRNIGLLWSNAKIKREINAGFSSLTTQDLSKIERKKRGFKLDGTKRNPPPPPQDWNSGPKAVVPNTSHQNRQLRYPELTTKLPRTNLSKNFLEKTPKNLNEDKNTASDGFGYISRKCDELVPGMVSDGAGGCTKPVKPKKKILQLERRRRGTRSVLVNTPASGDDFRSHNFTIRISIKGFEKRLDFQTSTTPKPNDGGDKAVADNGFGVNTSRCSSLVPGLVPDGAGGCTKAVKGIRKRNKFSFVLRTSGGEDSISEVEYENEEVPTGGIGSVFEDNDPEADII